MPIRISRHLPAHDVLQKERVFVMDENRSATQDIRPLEIAILNLMPDKISTETQLLRVLGATPLQLNVTFLRPETHNSKNTAKEHLDAFYTTFSQIKHQCYDALIVTGAPVEQMPFAEVTYWSELQDIFDWAASHVYSCLFLCWGAQAAMFHYHDIDKLQLPQKRFGVYTHLTSTPYHPLTNGFDDSFGVPVSRHTEVILDDILKVPSLEVFASSDEAGACLVYEEDARRVYMFNHLEYDAETLKKEYDRDVAKLGKDQVPLPRYYYPDDDPLNKPHITWRAHRNLLFSNWINIVYQGTPYNLTDLLK